MVSGWSRRCPRHLHVAQLVGASLTPSCLGTVLLGVVPGRHGPPDAMEGSLGSLEGHLMCALTEATKSNYCRLAGILGPRPGFGGVGTRVPVAHPMGLWVAVAPPASSVLALKQPFCEGDSFSPSGKEGTASARSFCWRGTRRGGRALCPVVSSVPLGPLGPAACLSWGSQEGTRG